MIKRIKVNEPSKQARGDDPPKQTVYDFSSFENRQAFKDALVKNTIDWNKALPNFEWINHTEFCRGPFFMYSDWVFFTRALGGRGQTPLPDEWTMNRGITVYARCFIGGTMGGYLLLPNNHYKKSTDAGQAVYGEWKSKLYIGKFRFCRHDMLQTKVGKCLNKYDCKLCGFSETIDSSG